MVDIPGVIVGRDCHLDPAVLFRPTDVRDVRRDIHIGDGCRLGAGAVIHGGVRLADGVVVEEGVIVGTTRMGLRGRQALRG